MRRIIERVVTVVTTTTWTISWQGDPLDPHSGSIADDFPKPDVPHETAKRIQKFTSLMTTKEADESETEIATDQAADEPPDHSYSKQ